MKHAFNLFKPLCVATTLLILSNQVFASDCSKDGILEVTGYAEVFASPDMAKLSFEAKASGKDAKKVRETAEKKAFDLIESAKKLGLTKENIVSQSISLYPVYEYKDSSRVFVGYNASRPILFKVSDFTLIEKLTDIALKVGIDEIGGFSYELKDSSSLKKQADELAMKNAIDKAKRLADGFSVKLNGVCKLNFSNESVSNRPVREYALLKANSDSAPVAEYTPSDIKVSSSVHAVYSIK